MTSNLTDILLVEDRRLHFRHLLGSSFRRRTKQEINDELQDSANNAHKFEFLNMAVKTPLISLHEYLSQQLATLDRTKDVTINDKEQDTDTNNDTNDIGIENKVGEQKECPLVSSSVDSLNTVRKSDTETLKIDMGDNLEVV